MPLIWSRSIAWDILKKSAEAYEALYRTELQFQFGDDEELERYDLEEAERNRVLAEFCLIRNTPVQHPSSSVPCAVRTPIVTEFNPPQPLSKGGGMLQAQQIIFVNNVLFLRVFVFYPHRSFNLI